MKMQEMTTQREPVMNGLIRAGPIDPQDLTATDQNVVIKIRFWHVES